MRMVEVPLIQNYQEFFSRAACLMMKRISCGPLLRKGHIQNEVKIMYSVLFFEIVSKKKNN